MDTTSAGRARRAGGAARLATADGLLVGAAALFVLASGVVHLREWLDTYRHVPAAAPGAFVVRLGFPLHVAASVVVAAALLVTARWARRLAPAAWAAAVVLQVGSVVALVLSRRSSVLGWSEPGWSDAAELSLVLAVGALVDLAALAALAALRRRGRRRSPGATPVVA